MSAVDLLGDEVDIPFVPWSAVAQDFMDAWEQGEHLIAIGKTGRGKTTLVNDIMERRWAERDASVCSFVAKKRDRTSLELIDRGWHHTVEWPPTYKARRDRRVLLWPPYTKASTYAKDVRATFLSAIDEIMEESAWTLYLDEAPYFVESMGLRRSMDELFNQARSNDVTLIAGMQRPAWISRSMVSQHCWVAAFRIGDMDDARRAGEVLGDRTRYTPVLLNLGEHDFLLANTITDEAIISRVGT